MRVCVTWQICVTWLIYVWRDSLIWDMTPSYVWHDSFICVTWLLHICDMTHSYVWHYRYVRHDSFMYDVTYSCICVPWLLHICDMTHSCSDIIDMCDMTRLCMTWLTDMGWLRLVGSLKLQVSFAEYRLFYRSLFQKRYIIYSFKEPTNRSHPLWLIHMCDVTHASVLEV